MRGRPDRRAGRQRRTVLVVLAVTLLSVLGALWRWSDPYEPKATVDTTQYARVAYALHGAGEAEAARRGFHLTCHYWRAIRPAPDGASVSLRIPHPLLEECAHAVTPRMNARYRAIFDARPGYPALVAAAMPLFGTRSFAVVSVLLAAAAGLAVAWAATMAGAGAVGAVTAAVLLFLLPSGFWITRMAPEGGMFLGLALVLAGTALLAHRGRTRLGAGVAALGVAATFAFKSADATAVAVVAAVALLLLAVPGRSAGSIESAASAAGIPSTARRPALVGAVAVLAVAAAVSGLAAVLGAPGFRASLQDLFSHHYLTPPPHNVFRLLLRDDERLLRHLGGYGWPWGSVIAVVGSAVACILVLGRRGGLLVVPAVVGLLVVLAHPVVTELPRLVAPAWLTVALAGGIVVSRISAAGTRRSRAPARDTGP